MTGEKHGREEDRLSHVDTEGRPRMVDVTGKDATRRTAVAEGTIRMAPGTLEAIRENRTPKGDVLTVAEIAGVTAGKRTADLIPFCHPLPLTSLRVTVDPDEAIPGIRVRAEARVVSRTGVEMEALTAVSVALLTVYDMAKALDRQMVIGDVRLLRKEGGASGAWAADESGEGEEPPPFET